VNIAEALHLPLSHPSGVRVSLEQFASLDQIIACAAGPSRLAV